MSPTPGRNLPQKLARGPNPLDHVEQGAIGIAQHEMALSEGLVAEGNHGLVSGRDRPFVSQRIRLLGPGRAAPSRRAAQLWWTA